MNQEIIQECYKLTKYKTEHVMVIGIDSQGHLLKSKVIASGTKDNCTFNDKVVFDFLDSNCCTDFILCHNHTDGLLEPSEEDDILTKGIRTLYPDFNYNFLDHIIVKQDITDKYYSYAEHNFEYSELNRKPKIIIRRR